MRFYGSLALAHAGATCRSGLARTRGQNDATIDGEARAISAVLFLSGADRAADRAACEDWREGDGGQDGGASCRPSADCAPIVLAYDGSHENL